MKTLLVLGYAVIGLLQIAAVFAGVALWMDVPGILSWFLAVLVGGMPVVGGIVGMAGAHFAWGWSWLGSFLLFFGWFFVFLAGAFLWEFATDARHPTTT